MLGYFVIGFICLVILSIAAIVVSLTLKLVRRILDK